MVDRRCRWFRVQMHPARHAIPQVEVGDSNGLNCKECGFPEDSPNHIRYGSDLDNPMKHEFEPDVPSEYARGYSEGRSTLIPLVRKLVVMLDNVYKPTSAKDADRYALIDKAKKEVSE